MKICRICLRTDVKLLILSDNEDLADFYEELCNFSAEKGNKSLCTQCEGVLTRCYNFKQLCVKADEVLRNWKKKTKDKPSLEDLYQNLPQNKDIPKIEEQIFVEHIKSEIPIQFIETGDFQNDGDPYKVTCDSDNVKVDDLSCQNADGYDSRLVDRIDSGIVYADVVDINRGASDGLADSDSKNVDVSDILMEDAVMKNDDDDFDADMDDDDDDDKFLSLLKKETDEEREKERMEIKKGRREKGKSKRKPATVQYGRPIHNQKELEKTFDIEIFSSEVEAIKHFEQRCTTDPYVSADYKCNVCYTVYLSQKKLDHHMKAHEPSVGDYVCNICQMRYKKNAQLIRHKSFVHYGVYKCKMCSLITYYRNVMLQHADKHKGILFKCEHCNRIFGHRNTFLTHLRTAHTSNHICDVCARTFVSEVGLLMHRSRAHNKVTMRKHRRVKEEKAREEKAKEESVKAPQTVENGPVEDTATCSECKITFASHAVYIVHVLTTPRHKDIASAMIACKFCGLEFNSRSNLIIHKRKMHLNKYKTQHKEGYSFGPDGKIFKCTECGVQGKCGLWLYRHHTSHHPDIPYEQHNEQRKHLCEQCGQSFYTASALRHHNYKHTGVKPYPCEVCGAKFRTKIGLKSHAEIHAPPRRECAHCGKLFYTASSLSNHMRSHIGDRRYKCEICGKGFLHNAALREHVRGVHFNIKRQRKSNFVNTNII